MFHLETKEGQGKPETCFLFRKNELYWYKATIYAQTMEWNLSIPEMRLIMYQINFSNPISIHFIGIGGISMSGLASILLTEGFTVSGSDAKASPLTDELSAKGAVIYYGHRASNIADSTQAVVYTAAVKEDNIELQTARAKGIPALTRAELLGQLMLNYKTAIGVAGTHGKTTTTGMLSHVLLAAETDPTISIGGILPSIGGNIRVGGSDVFLTEACEYTNSFLSFHPTMEIILNIKADHLDFFKDLDDIRHSFHLFAEKLDQDGLLVINGDTENLSAFLEGLDCNIRTFGADPKANDYSASDITYDAFGCASFTVLEKGQELTRITLNVPGIHNVYNALSVVALCRHMELPVAQIQKGLSSFTGTNRRFQKKGEIGGVTIVDDYAHHPDEIAATLAAAKNYPHRKIWCVFQPHTYTRTKALLDDFAKTLAAADAVVLADIYAARETDTLGVSSRDLQEKIQALGTDVYYFPSFDEIENFLLENCINGDLLITMGAGDIVKVGESILGL